MHCANEYVYGPIQHKTNASVHLKRFNLVVRRLEMTRLIIRTSSDVSTDAASSGTAHCTVSGPPTAHSAWLAAAGRQRTRTVPGGAAAVTVATYVNARSTSSDKRSICVLQRRHGDPPPSRWPCTKQYTIKCDETSFLCVLLLRQRYVSSHVSAVPMTTRSRRLWLVLLRYASAVRGRGWETFRINEN